MKIQKQKNHEKKNRKSPHPNGTWVSSSHAENAVF